MTCEEYVSNPEHMSEAYWSIRRLDVYQRTNHEASDMVMVADEAGGNDPAAKEGDAFPGLGDGAPTNANLPGSLPWKVVGVVVMAVGLLGALLVSGSEAGWPGWRQALGQLPMTRYSKVTPEAAAGGLGKFPVESVQIKERTNINASEVKQEVPLLAWKEDVESGFVDYTEVTESVMVVPPAVGPSTSCCRTSCTGVSPPARQFRTRLDMRDMTVTATGGEAKAVGVEGFSRSAPAKGLRESEADAEDVGTSSTFAGLTSLNTPRTPPMTHTL